MWLKKEKRILPLLGAQTLSELATSVVSYSLILWAYGQTGAAFDISLLSVAAAYRSRGICLLRRELAEQGVSVDTGREGFR